MPDRLRELETFRMIDFLGTTPVIVVRLWFSGANLLGDKTSGVFIDYSLLDNFFVLSNLQKSFHSRDETVLEVQAYLVEDEIELPDNPLMELVLADLRRAFTTLNMPPRKYYIQRHKSVFTSHVAGSDEYRPDTRTPVSNLYLAGDWVTCCPEVWNMERAIVTGKQAAAAVIEDAGGVGPAILPVPLGGPLFSIFVAIVREVNDLGGWLGRLVRGDSPPALPMVRVEPKWNSIIRFVAVNFRGQPNEQFLTGKIRNLIGKLKFMKSSTNFRATGDFLIDLESFDSGNKLQDYYVRARVFNTPINPYAKFRLIEIRPLDGAMLEIVFDKEFLVDCAGELTLNNVMQPLCFRAKLFISRNGLVSVLTEDDIVIHASDFKLDLDSLHVHDGAVVDNEIRLSFRLAVPFEVL
jgi:hypothetical protein